ncbi:hypothetical protein [Amycolatopsis thermoflava]|uniref:hypothetical protein n=1 Tax=Amycolatopsis thermoflava TaxID=84480 RepID=UPI003D706262
MPQLCRAEDLSALSVRAAAESPRWGLLSRALGAAGAGEVAGDHVWLDVSWLRSAAGDRDQDWHDGFTRMLDQAARQGWVSADGGRVRAHVEWGR